MALRPLPARKVLKVLFRLGFVPIRQKGGHVILEHPDGRITVVPNHPREEIDRGLLRKIIKDIDLEPEEFMDLL
jgi:predicted RNA binding protein YcfA (HicA-like mRNA interferase family)